MVNFLVNLAGPQCPDMWPNIILAITLRVFWGEINIGIGALHTVGGTRLIS